MDSKTPTFKVLHDGKSLEITEIIQTPIPRTVETKTYVEQLLRRQEMLQKQVDAVQEQLDAIGTAGADVAAIKTAMPNIIK